MSNIDNIKNKKLRAMAELAQQRSRGDFGMTVLGGVDLEQFAKLIINDCLKCCKAVQDDDTLTGIADGAFLCHEEIKEHFTIEDKSED